MDAGILIAKPADAFGGDTCPQRSPAIFGSMQPDIANEGAIHFDDFETLGVSGSVWTLLEADATADINLTEFLGGEVEIELDTTINMEGSLQLGDGVGTAFLLGNAEGDLFFEARVRTNSITDNSAFIGFSIAGTGADFQADASGILAGSFLGFRTLDADSLNLDTVHGLAGTEVVVEEAVHAFVLDEFVKLGITIKKGLVTFFVNGIPQANTAQATDVNFPIDLGVMPILAGKLGGTTAMNLNADRIDTAQMLQ